MRSNIKHFLVPNTRMKELRMHISGAFASNWGERYHRCIFYNTKLRKAYTFFTSFAFRKLEITRCHQEPP